MRTRRNDPAGALAAYQQALDIDRRLAAATPTDGDLQVAVATDLQTLASARPARRCAGPTWRRDWAVSHAAQSQLPADDLPRLAMARKNAATQGDGR